MLCRLVGNAALVARLKCQLPVRFCESHTGILVNEAMAKELNQDLALCREGAR